MSEGEKKMKIITWDKREPLHVETPLGIVNIRCGLSDMRGRAVDSVEIIENQYAGEQKVVIRPGKHNIRLVQLNRKF